MIGSRLGHYQILERLGRGGMGVVWRARDERLQREVALKLLPEGSLADPDARQQFLHEAVAASRVNHPNIGVVYEFGADAGTEFLAMEMVAGESLEARMSRGTLGEAETAALGAQLADALAALHASGIAHLDLKPANVVLTPEGRPKIVDFGLSRWFGGAAARTGGAASSVELAIAGTFAYMAPERFARGVPDPRSDLWSLGVLLYRALCGRLPFEGDDAAMLTYAILNTEPVPPRTCDERVSPGFEAVLVRALARDPTARFASAADMAAALRERTTEPLPAPRIDALAVLPLADLSPGGAQEFFADGMTDALLDQLAGLEGVRVISRTSAMRYKGSPLSLPQIARELGVQAVVEGTVHRAGPRVRLTARLVEAAADRTLWTSRYERELADVFELHDELAAEIAREVRSHLPAAGVRRAGRPNVSAEAYELYLRGRHLWNRRTPEDVRAAQRMFEDAIALAPSFAPAHAGLADAFNVLGDLAEVGPELARRSALAAAERALAIDPRLPEAHTAVGFVRVFHEWDWDGAEASFRRALAAGPGWATAHQWYAELLSALARFGEAEEHARHAVELDPLAFVLHTTVSDVLFFARRYDDAIAVLRATLELAPDVGAAWMDLGRVHAQIGRHDEAIRWFEGAIERMPGAGRATSGLAYAHARAGHHDEARRRLPSLIEQIPSGNVTHHAIAVIHLELGERDAALDWLERSFAARDRALVWLAVHPRLDPLREEPRFRSLLGRMRLDDAAARTLHSAPQPTGDT